MHRPATHKPVIGLLGGIGAGKTTVAREFARQGCAVIDADDLSRKAIEEPTVRDALVEWWGHGVLTPDGRVDRKAVSRIVFNDPAQLRRLESVVHPRVHAGRAALRLRYQADPDIVAIVEDCPLLLESGLDRSCDALILVHASRATRLARVGASSGGGGASGGRGWTAEELDRREKNQVPLDIKAERADDVINNDADADPLADQVRRVLSRILQGKV